MNPIGQASSRRPGLRLGDEESGVLVEWVRRKGVLRIHPSHSGAEVSLPELLNALEVDRAVLVPDRQHLLFASVGAAAGGTEDLLEVFASEAEARQAFLRLRQAALLHDGWAELAAIDRAGQVSVLCSFGRGRPVPWRPRKFAGRAVAEVTHPLQREKGTAMSTDTITQAEVGTGAPELQARRRKYKLATAVLGLAAFGALVLSSVGGGSTSPSPSPAPASSQLAPSLERPPVNEVFVGCLNDIECYGEPSQLPQGHWDLPGTIGGD
jgi:hypothetical protein